TFFTIVLDAMARGILAENRLFDERSLDERISRLGRLYLFHNGGTYAVTPNKRCYTDGPATGSGLPAEAPAPSVSPTLNREKRRIEMFSPSFAMAWSTNSFTVIPSSLMKCCSRRQFSS